jgi:aspartyl-tRNA(Asn)/glutamyl-tRNA(Gln) amidotransferase subunit B
VGASDADMEKGNLRCEANVSVRRVGDTEFGTKVELKNLNSVRFMQKAIEFEIERQIALIESGGKVTQETRLWDDKRGETRVMRSKEEAHDYRYFPEPDLQPLVVSGQWIEEVKATMPELPGPRRRRFINDYGLSYADADQLTSDRALADFYEETARLSGNPRAASNWIRSDVLRELETSGHTAATSPVAASSLAELIQAVDTAQINGKQAKDVLAEMFATGHTAAAIIAAKGLAQVSDTGAIDAIIEEVLAANPNQLAQFRGGKEGLFGFFVGQVMKASQGKANPNIVNQRLRAKLSA